MRRLSLFIRLRQKINIIFRTSNIFRALSTTWKRFFFDHGHYIQYTWEFKLNEIKRAMNQNISCRKLAVELELIDPQCLRDWLDLYEKKG